MKWFTLRVVFRHGLCSREEAVYEERLLLYRSDTAESALERTQRDVASYLDSNPDFALVGDPALFAVSELGSDLDGVEVWSCLHRGPARADEFWADRYQKYPAPVQSSSD